MFVLLGSSRVMPIVLVFEEDVMRLFASKLQLSGRKCVLQWLDNQWNVCGVYIYIYFLIIAFIF